MTNGNFYFLTDEYCEKFKKYGVMSNKENGHNRPCYYLMSDSDNTDLFWMIPVSSKIKKYDDINQKKLEKYHIKDNNGMVFGYVRGRKAVFLIQNICPVLKENILEEYIDSNTGEPVFISHKIKSKLTWKSKQIITTTKQGIRCTITNIHKILEELGIDINIDAK